MLGREICEQLEATGRSFIGTDREVDITVGKSLRTFASGQEIRWIINCAGYTAVDRAEEEPEIARALNAEGAGNLAKMAFEIQANLVHISTDYVFDGRSVRPYREEDPVTPLGVYGRTKVEGERLVTMACPSSYIIRTAWLYGHYGKNFVQTMLRLMGKQDKIGVVADQRGSPTNAADLAAAIIIMIDSAREAFGIYHFAGEGDASWYDFAVAIQEGAVEFGASIENCRIEAIRTEQYPTKAIRPQYSVLCKDKIRSTFGLEVPAWRESLRRHLRSTYGKR